MSNNEIVIEMPRFDWEKVLDALNYAIEDRQYQASCTQDPEDKATIEACANEWEKLKEFIKVNLGEEKANT